MSDKGDKYIERMCAYLDLKFILWHWRTCWNERKVVLSTRTYTRILPAALVAKACLQDCVARANPVYRSCIIANDCAGFCQ